MESYVFGVQGHQKLWKTWKENDKDTSKVINTLAAKVRIMEKQCGKHVAYGDAPQFKTSSEDNVTAEKI